MRGSTWIRKPHEKDIFQWIRTGEGHFCLLQWESRTKIPPVQTRRVGSGNIDPTNFGGGASKTGKRDIFNPSFFPQEVAPEEKNSASQDPAPAGLPCHQHKISVFGVGEGRMGTNPRNWGQRLGFWQGLWGLRSACQMTPTNQFPTESDQTGRS